MWLQSSCWQELNHLNTPSQLFIASQTFPNGSLTVIVLLPPFYRSRNWGSGITSIFSQCPTFIQRSYWKYVRESNVIGMREGRYLPVTRTLWDSYFCITFDDMPPTLCACPFMCSFPSQVNMVGQLTSVSVKLKLKIYWFVCPMFSLLVLNSVTFLRAIFLRINTNVINFQFSTYFYRTAKGKMK